MKKILFILLGLGLIGAGIAYYMYNKPVESLKNKKAAVEVSAAKLLSDYEADENAANDLYLGKVIQVSGKVESVVDEGGKMKVQLGTGSPMSLIICEIEDGKDVGKTKAGDEINVKGMCSGYLSDVIIVQSNIVQE